MNYGQEQEITIRTVPANAVDYYLPIVKSSDLSIAGASFNDFYNTLLLESKYKTGNAVITISLGGKTAECQVKVAPEPVKSLTLSNSEITLAPGENKTVYFSTDPYDSIDYYDAVWTTSNPSAATVEGGGKGSAYANIQAMEAGEADITLVFGGQTALCHVTVQP